MKKAAVWIVLVLCAGVALASLRYLLPGSPGAPDNVVANRFAGIGALGIHIAGATVALLVGPLQFLPNFRGRHPRWHRRAGTLYVICCGVGGLAGLTLALGTTAGPVAVGGFGLLALGWLGSTGNAWRLAKAGDFERHPRWMIRSFAFTFAAVTLRLYLPIAAIAHVDFMTGYRAISFLCWVPNIAVAELYLARRGVTASLPLAATSQSPG